MSKYTTFSEQVTYGIDSIEPGRTVSIELRDAVYLHQLLRELHRFLEQPRHYPDLEDIAQFVGDSDQGALKVISHAYRDILLEPSTLFFRGYNL